MLGLKQFRDQARGVPDLLNWAALIDEGIVLGKDAALISGWFFKGPDVASMTPAERNYLTSRVNAVFARMGSEWAFWFEASRFAAPGYPDPSLSHFPDPISRLIDEERRQQFLEEGSHFETEHALIVMYVPPLRRNSRIVDLIYDDDKEAEKLSPSERHIAAFKRALIDIEDALGDVLNLRRMGAFEVVDDLDRSHLQDELVNYLQFCLTGELGGLNIPPCAMYLDAVMGGQEFWSGDTPKIGDRFICCLALEGFPHESFPVMLSVLDDIPVAYRFSTRFLPLDQIEAVDELSSFRRKWTQQKRGFMQQVFRTKGGYVNEDAVAMEAETERALSDARSDLVAYGHYTPVIVLMGLDRTVLEEQARIISRQIRSLGFASRRETVNTVEAWLGSLPGHVHPNVRRPLIHSLNLADLIPISAKWPGLYQNPNPLFPPGSPPLIHAATTGATPFRLNLHVDDVGHTMIFGPTGSGKSVLLGTIAAQFLRYPNARIAVFDKGQSMFALVQACGGTHYDLGGGEGSPGLCPLAELDSDTDALWAQGWIATCYELQTGEALTPHQREQVQRAIALMRQNKAGGRTLTDFLATVQDTRIRSALSAYTIDGPLGSLLDNRIDELSESHFAVFEIDTLMGLGEKISLPVLLYLFHVIERALDGRPSMIMIDEAWVMLGHPVFREKFREWLKVMRKNNCLVVAATQSLSDAYNSGVFDVMLESCPTKILLPNEEADKAGSRQILGPRDIYAAVGLNDAEIAIVQHARKKRDYYAISSHGRRLFELGLGPIALAFLGASSREDIARIKALKRRHGRDWTNAWLEEKGIDHALSA